MLNDTSSDDEAAGDDPISTESDVESPEPAPQRRGKRTRPREIDTSSKKRSC